MNKTTTLPKWTWRALLLPISILITALVLTRFAEIIRPVLAVRYSWWLEAGMVAGQVLFQWLFLAGRGWAVRWDYAALVLLVSLEGAVLLLPLLAWQHWAGPVGLLPALGYFFMVVGLMFLDHWRRVKAAGLPAHLCFSWVLYRCLLLLFLVKWP